MRIGRVQSAMAIRGGGMKKLLTVALMLAIILLVGCGEEKKVTERSELDSKSKSAGVDKMIYASPKRTCTCPIDIESIDSYRSCRVC